MLKVKSWMDDFKSFAMKGNVLDLAVGVIIGGAFGKIVSSLVGDVIMPLIGLVAGRVNLSSLYLELVPEIGEKAAVLLKYGAFLQSIIDFIIIALSIYVFIKIISKFKRKQEVKEAVAAAEPTRTEVLLEEIRDLMKNRTDR